MNTIPCGTSHNIQISHTQVRGRYHGESESPCEDVVFTHRAQDFLFCGIADGKTGAAYGADGGLACLEAVAGYMETIGIYRIINTPFPDELPCMFVQEFRKRILALEKSKCVNRKEFASTMLAIAIDLRTGKYVLLHLGDGCAISVSNTGDVVIISAPDNGLTPYHTWLTTSDNVVPHLRITFGSLENKNRILLMSDGAVCFCRGENIPWRAKELLKDGSQLQLHEHLMQSNPSDDASCIILDFCD